MLELKAGMVRLKNSLACFAGSPTPYISASLDVGVGMAGCCRDSYQPINLVSFDFQCIFLMPTQLRRRRKQQSKIHSTEHLCDQSG